jgi:sigma-B regulation protein RsbQ
VTVPALVLQCLHDSIAPRSVGRYLELDASGHCPHLSHPQQTIAAIAGFVDAPHA